MDLVNYEQATLHTRGVNHRQGSFRYKDLGQGAPGRPENFYLRQVWTQGDFFSPRHMHNFDQVRVQIEGEFGFDKDGTMSPGCIAYFPEGTPYGPQTSAADTVQLVLQIGGPSGNGYLSEDERSAAVDRLSKQGRFEGGRYFAADDRTGAGKDAFQAAWEFANGRRIRYPKRRLEKPLLVHPAAFEWLELPDFAGVRYKRIWDFGSRSVGCLLYRLQAGTSLVVAGPQSSFVQSGAGAIGKLRFAKFDVLHLAPGESARIEAHADTELLAMSHPVFPHAAARSAAAAQSALESS
jgi:hypothetical protein